MGIRTKFQAGDYIEYVGDGANNFGKLDPENLGYIIEEKQLNGRDNYLIQGVNSGIQKWCRSYDIRNIGVTGEILMKIGFQPIVINLRSKYALLGINISECSFSNFNYSYPNPTHFYIFSGFCLGDFTIPLNDEERIITGDQVDMDIFYELYPSVHNFNDLLNFLNSKSIPINILEALS